MQKTRHQAGFWVFCATIAAAEASLELQRSYVSSCRAFLAVFDREFNFLTFFQRFETLVLDSREVYEHVFAAVSWGDKAETFLSVEPFY